MKQSKIIEAYKTLESLTDLKISLSEQWALCQLRTRLRPHIEFQDEQVVAIQKKYAPFINDKGMIEGKKAQEYMNDMSELKNLDVEVEEKEKIKIHFVEGLTFKITEPLEDFIEFIAPEE